MSFMCMESLRQKALKAINMKHYFALMRPKFSYISLIISHESVSFFLFPSIIYPSFSLYLIGHRVF